MNNNYVLIIFGILLSISYLRGHIRNVWARGGGGGGCILILLIGPDFPFPLV